MSPERLRHASSRRVDEALERQGLPGRVVELPSTTRTAEDAARAVGCEVRQIVKSLVFRQEPSGAPVLALVAGDHRLDEDWMLRTTGHRWVREAPERVRSIAGYPIGGVPPVGHSTSLPTYVDYDLLEQREVWAAAGHPNAICRLTSTELLRITGGRPMPLVPLASAPATNDVWVSFDCYGTLVDWRRGWVTCARREWGDLPEAEAIRMFHDYLTEEQTLEAGPYLPYREVMARAVRKVADRLGRPISEHAAARFPDSIPEWPIFPDSLEALRRLRTRGLKLAILSNTDRDLLERTVARHDLPADLLVSAEEVRSYKPALAHWIRFLKRTGIAPGRGWHVAGGYEYDVPPATLLGFQTAYIARDGPPPSSSVASLVCADLSELAERLGSAGSANTPDPGGERISSDGP